MTKIKKIMGSLLFMASLLACLSGTSMEKMEGLQPRELEECPICGELMFPIVTDTGKHIRLNFPPEKRFVLINEGELEPSQVVGQMRDSYIAHVWTCPGE